jgi:hypothetical protein
MGAALSGCSVITTAMPSRTDVTGEAWYTKTRWFIFPYSEEIYYCNGEKGECIQAEVE